MGWEQIPLLSGFGLGILLAFSPCPLTGNLLALSYLGIREETVPGTLRIGVIYGLGRAVAYFSLALILTRGLLAAPRLSFFLQTRMNLFVGPLLLLVGIALTGFWVLPISWSPGEKISAGIVRKGGNVASFLLGFFLALSFCPVSAALFFGSLLPLCISERSTFLVPLAFGIGTALPVVTGALAFAFLARKGQELFFSGLTRGGIILRKVTGWAFIFFGLYFSYQALTRLL